MKTLRFYEVLDKNGIKMPDHYSGRRRTFEEAKKLIERLNKDGEHAPYKMKKVPIIQWKKTMKTIEIWVEGYAASGQQAGAQKLGKYEAVDFDDAVKQYMEEHPDRVDVYIKGTKTRYTEWGCKLYDNEMDARKGFG